MHCEAECSSLKGSWMLFQAEQTCDGTYVHVWTRTYTDACSPAADSNSGLVSSDYINTALWVVRYLMTIYHKKYVKGKNTTKQTNKTKTCPTSSDWCLLVCNFVLVCCGNRYVCSINWALLGDGVRHFGMFTKLGLLSQRFHLRPCRLVNGVFIFLLHNSVESFIYRGIFHSVTLYVLFGSHYT